MENSDSQESFDVRGRLRRRRSIASGNSSPQQYSAISTSNMPISARATAGRLLADIPCLLCEKVYKKSGNVEKHFNDHRDINVYMCVVCERGFLLEKDLRVHKCKKLTTQSDSERFSAAQLGVVIPVGHVAFCVECGHKVGMTSATINRLKSYRSFQLLKKFRKVTLFALSELRGMSLPQSLQLRFHSCFRTVSTRCLLCDDFECNADMRRLLQHFKDSHQNETLRCHLCDDESSKEFATALAYHDHVLNDHSITPYTPLIRFLRSAPSLQPETQPIWDDDDEVLCKLCGFEFAAKDFNQHDCAVSHTRRLLCGKSIVKVSSINLNDVSVDLCRQPGVCCEIPSELLDAMTEETVLDLAVEEIDALCRCAKNNYLCTLCDSVFDDYDLYNSHMVDCSQLHGVDIPLDDMTSDELQVGELRNDEPSKDEFEGNRASDSSYSPSSHPSRSSTPASIGKDVDLEDDESAISKKRQCCERCNRTVNSQDMSEHLEKYCSSSALTSTDQQLPNSTNKSVRMVIVRNDGGLNARPASVGAAAVNGKASFESTAIGSGRSTPYDATASAVNPAAAALTRTIATLNRKQTARKSITAPNDNNNNATSDSVNSNSVKTALSNTLQPVRPNLLHVQLNVAKNVLPVGSTSGSTVPLGLTNTSFSGERVLISNTTPLIVTPVTVSSVLSAVNTTASNTAAPTPSSGSICLVYGNVPQGIVTRPPPSTISAQPNKFLNNTSITPTFSSSTTTNVNSATAAYTTHAAAERNGFGNLARPIAIPGRKSERRLVDIVERVAKGEIGQLSVRFSNSSRPSSTFSDSSSYAARSSPSASVSTADGQLECPVCRYSFPSIDPLKVHLCRDHLEICHRCTKCYVTKQQLIQHAMTNSQSECPEIVQGFGWSFTCVICQLTFDQLQTYYVHLIHNHANDVKFDETTGQVVPACQPSKQNALGAPTAANDGANLNILTNPMSPVQQAAVKISIPTTSKTNVNDSVEEVIDLANEDNEDQEMVQQPQVLGMSPAAADDNQSLDNSFELTMSVTTANLTRSSMSSQAEVLHNGETDNSNTPATSDDSSEMITESGLNSNVPLVIDESSDAVVVADAVAASATTDQAIDDALNVDSLLCNECGQLFLSQTELKKHSQEHSMPARKSCPICVENFEYEHQLTAHIKHNHITSPRCPMCSAEFGRVETALQHMLYDCYRTPNRRCVRCSWQAADFAALKQHMEELHAPPTYKCKHCNQHFIWKGKYLEHRNECQAKQAAASVELNGTESEYCSTTEDSQDEAASLVISESDTDNMSGITVQKLPDRLLQCMICTDTYFSNIDMLLTHLLTHSKQHYSHCFLCQCEFNTVKKFKDHVRGHSNEDKGERHLVLVVRKHGKLSVKLYNEAAIRNRTQVVHGKCLYKACVTPVIDDGELVLRSTGSSKISEQREQPVRPAMLVVNQIIPVVRVLTPVFENREAPSPSESESSNLDSRNLDQVKESTNDSNENDTMELTDDRGDPQLDSDEIEVIPNNNSVDKKTNHDRLFGDLTVNNTDSVADNPLEDDDIMVVESGAEDSAVAKRSGPTNVCSLCNRSFFTTLSFTEHMQSHKQDAGGTCDTVLPVPPSKQCMWICRVCCIAFPAVDVFSSHMVKHNASVSCPDCSAMCFTKDQISQHRDSHADGVVFGCAICCKAFKAEIYLQFHLNVAHKMLLVWICKICSEGFWRLDAVVPHVSQCHQAEIAAHMSANAACGTNIAYNEVILKEVAVCPHRKLHYQPSKNENPQDILNLHKDLPVGECPHRTFMAYAETMIACDKCGSMLGANKFMLENDFARQKGQIKLNLVEDPTELYALQQQYVQSQVHPSTAKMLLTSTNAAMQQQQLSQSSVQKVTAMTTLSMPTLSAILSAATVSSSTPCQTSVPTITQVPLREIGSYLRPTAQQTLTANRCLVPPPVSIAQQFRTPVVSSTNTSQIKTAQNTPSIPVNLASIKDNRLICAHCRFLCPSLPSLQVHLLKHQPSAAFFCLECGSAQRQRQKLVQHIEEAHKSKLVFELKCPLKGCDKVFNSQPEFLKHFRLPPHGSMLNGWLCHNCGMQYFTTLAYNSHISKHVTGTFCCVFCGECYSSLPKLQSHQIEHAFDWWLMCRECGLCYKTQPQADDHFMENHCEQLSNNSYGNSNALVGTCKMCNVRLDDILDHMKTMHCVAAMKLKGKLVLEKEYLEMVGLQIDRQQQQPGAVGGKDSIGSLPAPTSSLT